MDDLSRYATPEAALLKAVDEAGGAKVVGTSLRPEWDTAPDTASRWVHHCCGDSNRSKFGLRQLVWIFRVACRAGMHTGFQAFARLCGYNAIPLDTAGELAVARERAHAAANEAMSALQAIDTLIDNPRLLATLRAAHVNTEGMA